MTEIPKKKYRTLICQKRSGTSGGDLGISMIQSSSYLQTLEPSCLPPLVLSLTSSLQLDTSSVICITLPSVHVTCCVSMLCPLPHLIARSLCDGGSRPIGSHLSFLIMASTIVRTLCPHEDTAPSLVNTGDSIRVARHVCALP